MVLLHMKVCGATKKRGPSKKAKHLFIERDAGVNFKKTKKFPMTVGIEVNINLKVGGEDDHG